MHHFPWLRNRTTEHRKAGKARNTKENRRSKEFNTDLKQLVEHHSSLNVNFKVIRAHKNHPDTLNGWCAIRQEDNEK